MMGYGLGYGYGSMMGGYGFGGLLMLLLGPLVIAAIALLIIWAVRLSHGQGTHTAGAPPYGAAGHDEAALIIKRRLASGEITPEQYGEIMRALGI